MKKYQYIIGTVLITASMAACATVTEQLRNNETESAYEAGVESSPEETEAEVDTIIQTEPETETEEETETESETETPEETTLSEEEQAQLLYEQRKSVLEQYRNLGVVVGVENNLNIRECAKDDGLVIGKALEYAGLEIISEEGSWYKVQIDDSYGYVTKKYVVTGEEAEKLAIEHATQKAVVTAQVLNVRKGPSTLTSVLHRVSVKDRYNVVEQFGKWTKIEILDGVSGYVSNDFISVDYFLPNAYIIKEYQGLSEIRRNLISMAFEYLGGKYVWGGTTLGVGVDCSGFMLRLYEAQGITINRVSIDQARNGKGVTSAQMKPGDLVFYETRGPFISHVAMYIGDGKIIHAASEKKGICINEWDYIPPVAIRNIVGD